MTSYIIIEDEDDAQELLYSILSKHCTDLLFRGSAPSIKLAKKLIEKKSPQLVFADIHLSDGNIFQLLDHLPEIDFAIIFITAYDKYALKAFEFNTINYILKPFDTVDIIKSVERMKKDSQLAQKIEELAKFYSKNITRIGLSTSKGIIMVDIDNIIHMKADRSYSTIYLRNQNKILCSKPLGDIEIRLPQNIFFRVHTSHLVNLNLIDLFEKEDGGQLVMTNGDRIPVSRRKKKELIHLLLN